MGVFFDVQRFETTINLKKYPVTKVFSVANIATDYIDAHNDRVQSIAGNNELDFKAVSWSLSDESDAILNELFDLSLDDESDTLSPATFEILYNPIAVAGVALHTAATALRNSIPTIKKVTE